MPRSRTSSRKAGFNQAECPKRGAVLRRRHSGRPMGGAGAALSAARLIAMGGYDAQAMRRHRLQVVASPVRPQGRPVSAAQRRACPRCDVASAAGVIAR
jgi:hypothetical protein